MEDAYVKFQPIGSPNNYSSKNPDPLNLQKQQLCLVLDYQSLSKSINTTHKDNDVISYYPLPNITDLLARLQKCTLFSSLDLRSGYHHIVLALEAKPEQLLPQQMVNGNGM